MTQPPAGQLSAFYPPYYQGGGGGQLDPHLNLANDLRLVYQHTSYKERVARATRNVLDQVGLHLCCNIVLTTLRTHNNAPVTL